MSAWNVLLIAWALLVVVGLVWLAWAVHFAKSDVEIWRGGDRSPERRGEPALHRHVRKAGG